MQQQRCPLALTGKRRHPRSFIDRVAAAAAEPQSVNGHVHQTGSERDISRSCQPGIYRRDRTETQINAGLAIQPQQPAISFGRSQRRIAVIKSDSCAGVGKVRRDDFPHRGSRPFELLKGHRAKITGDQCCLRHDVVFTEGGTLTVFQIMCDVSAPDNMARVKRQVFFLLKVFKKQQQDPGSLIDCSRTNIFSEYLRRMGRRTGDFKQSS